MEPFVLYYHQQRRIIFILGMETDAKQCATMASMMDNVEEPHKYSSNGIKFGLKSGKHQFGAETYRWVPTTIPNTQMDPVLASMGVCEYGVVVTKIIPMKKKKDFHTWMSDNNLTSNKKQSHGFTTFGGTLVKHSRPLWCGVETFQGYPCSKCGKLARRKKQTKKCSACLSVKYCDKKCQLADWKTHKKVCAQLSLASLKVMTVHY